MFGKSNGNRNIRVNNDEKTVKESKQDKGGGWKVATIKHLSLFLARNNIEKWEILIFKCSMVNFILIKNVCI